MRRKIKEDKNRAGPDLNGRGKDNLKGIKSSCKGKFKPSNKLTKFHSQGQKRIDTMIGRMMENEGHKTLVRERGLSSESNGLNSIPKGIGPAKSSEYDIKVHTSHTISPKPK